MIDIFIKHQAITELYPNVANINGDIAKDSDGNIIEYDESAVNTRAQELQDAEPLRKLRFWRDELLKETDWWVLPDRTATDEQLAYRQALRDITDTYSSLDDVVWPTKP